MLDGDYQLLHDQLQQHVLSGRPRSMDYLKRIPGTEVYEPSLLTGEEDLDFISPRLPARPILCNDGFTVSVQASVNSYCTPRQNFGPYTHFELGFPSAVDELIMPYCDDAEHPTDTVYPYVPVDVVLQLLIKHGTMKLSPKTIVPPIVPLQYSQS